jgi:hypothetical protein
MSKMRIETHPSLEAYVGEDGKICLKQGGTDGKDKIISIPLSNVKKVIEWLQILYKEQDHKTTPDEFAAED